MNTHEQTTATVQKLGSKSKARLRTKSVIKDSIKHTAPQLPKYSVFSYLNCLFCHSNISEPQSLSRFS